MPKTFTDELKRIESLFVDISPGEQVTAEIVIQRMLEKMQQFQKNDPPKEYKFSFDNRWSVKLFIALLRRYHIRPYRYTRQRYTTVMAKVSKTFTEKVLWPEFQELNLVLQTHIDGAVADIIRESIFADGSDIEEVQGVAQE